MITNETPPRACLADFGLSVLIPGTQGTVTTTTAGGTPFYMAPELLLPRKFNKTSAHPTKPGDIYAFGMTMFEVLTGFQPFYDKDLNSFEIVLHVANGGRPTKPENFEQIGFGDGTWELVKECWVEESESRPTIEQVLSHLKRVAASSTVVGPIPKIPDNYLDSYSTSKRFVFLARNKSHLDLKGTMNLPPRRTASSDDLATIGTVSASRTVSTSSDSTLASSDGYGSGS